MKKILLMLSVISISAIMLTGCTCKHEKWNGATCTTPKTCAKCGVTQGEPLGHKWKDATCETPKTCDVCGEIEGTKLDHEWSEATCESPKTCKKCGETEGEKLDHEWIEATCKAPKTCENCGKTEGEKLDHEWAEASCTSPKKCKICGQTEGKALGHSWTNATCTSPKTCTVCGKKDGSELGHDFKNGYCTRCNAKDPNYLFLSDVSTIEELEKYLNNNYSSIDTPYGTVPVNIEINYPKTNTEKSMYRYDMYIQCDADFFIVLPKKKITENNWVHLPYDMDSIYVSDSERQEVVNIMKSYQKKIADDAMTCFPSSYIMGGFYYYNDGGWSITDDDISWHDPYDFKYFTWTNFVGESGVHSYYDAYTLGKVKLAGFGWASDADDKWYGYND